MERVFAYGTLHHDSIQRYLWGETKEGETATLKDFERTSGITIKRSPGHNIPGAIYELTPDQLKQTDLYEGCPHSYTREQELVNGESTWVYVPTDHGNAFYLTAREEYV